MFDKVSTRKSAPIGLYGWAVDLPDASNFFDLPLNGAAITDTQGFNYSFYNNPEVNRLIVQADLAFDPADRKRMLQRMEAIVMEDSSWAPVVREGRAFLRSRRLHGLKAHPVWKYRLDALWLIVAGPLDFALDAIRPKHDSHCNIHSR
jgi:ABC-type oligopeptide transport system substrate-binding subunit